MMQILANGLFLSAFYVSFAVGLTLIFGVMRTINFAHGEFYMLGGYVLWLLYPQLSGMLGSSITFAICLLAGFLAMGLLGMLLYRFIVSPLEADPFAVFMATLGLSFVLQVLVVQFVGPMGRSVPPVFPGIIKIGGAILPWQRIAIAIVTIGTITALAMFLKHSNAGRAIRATAQNSVGALLQGMSPFRTSMIAMALGSALAGMSGVLMATALGVSPFMGGEAIWRAFIVVIVGGIGSIPGAVAAGLLFGFLDTALGAFNLSQFVALTNALIMLLVLSFLPNGILGRRD